MFDKKIKIDKEFLNDILKKISHLEDKIKLLTEQREIINEDYMFICTGTQFTQDKIQAQLDIDAFKKEIEPIAEKYKIVSFSGSFVKKL